MRKCSVENCNKNARCNSGESIWAKYCPMHTERLNRHGTLETKKDSGLGHGLEQLPHELDNIIISNVNKKDIDILKIIQDMGLKNINKYHIRYRRRKLGYKKYDGKNSKERAKKLAIKEYGNKCEICEYDATVDLHHIHERRNGGDHAISNLMIICPNCHALITRKLVKINSRNEIEQLKKDISELCHNNS